MFFDFNLIGDDNMTIFKNAVNTTVLFIKAVFVALLLLATVISQPNPTTCLAKSGQSAGRWNAENSADRSSSLVISKPFVPAIQAMLTKTEPLVVKVLAASTFEKTQSDLPAETPIVFPVGKIGTSHFIDLERSTYDGTMYLEVPAMGYSGIVLDGTTSDILQKGAGLFTQGQLPGVENRNVCIAGHRDIEGGPFMDIDKLGELDLIYITYKNKRYTYEYEKTMFTKDSDWSAVRVKEYSAITLMSCDPPWAKEPDRIFAIGRLISIEDVYNLPEV